MTQDYQVRLVKLPHTVHEAVTENSDGTYTIFINLSLNKAQQEEAFLHALRHITGHDFEKNDVDHIENECHRLEIADEICAFF